MASIEIKPGEVNVIPVGTRGNIRLYERHNGTLENPTIIRAERVWESVVSPGEYHGIWADENQQIRYVVVEDMVVRGGTWDGIRFYHSRDLVIRNCLIQDNHNMGILLGEDENSTIESCVVERNGAHAEQYGYGMYLNGTNITVRNNLVRDNANGGIQLWPAGTKCTIERNTVSGHEKGIGIVVQRPTGAYGLKPELANVIRENLIVRNATGIRLWRTFSEKIERNVINCPAAIYVSSAKGPVLMSENAIAGKLAGNTNAISVAKAISGASL